MKVGNIILKVVLCLLLISPILGALGFFPAPTADLYNTPEAFSFIEALTASGYINVLIAVVFALALILIITKRTAVAVLLLLPVVVNIVAFHALLDGGLFTAGAMMGNLLLLLTAYFLYQNRAAYAQLWNYRS